MARLPLLCDVPGCGRSRRRRQRTCDSCFARLPGEIRVGLNEAKHQRREKDWRELRERAARFLNLHPDRTGSAAATVSPQRAYELQQRLLGERP